MSDADFGALFGPPGDSTRVNCMQWSPPTAPNERILSPDSLLPSSNRTARHLPKQQVFAKTEDLQEACNHSRRHLQALLLPREELRVLDAEDVQPFIGFLQSSEDMTEAGNIMQLLRWLRIRQLTPDAAIALTEVIVDKIKLGTILPTQVRKIARVLPDTVHWRSDGLSRRALLQCFVAIQRATDQYGRWMDDTQLMKTRRALCVADLAKSNDRDTCFFALKRLAALMGVTQVEDQALVAALTRILDPVHDPRTGTRSHREVVYAAIRKFTDRSPDPARTRQAIVEAEHQVRLERLKKKAIGYKRSAVVVPVSGTTTLATRLVQTNHLSLAISRFASDPGAEPEAFAQHWFSIASRQRSPNERRHNPLGLALGLLSAKSHGQVTPSIMSFLQHLASITASADPGFSTRQAFRWIWQCYRFLRQRGQEPNAAVVRALLHAGVLRALRDSDVVPRQRLAYVQALVEKTEGHRVASDVKDQIQQLVKERQPSRADAELQKAVKALLTGSLSSSGYETVRKKMKARGWL